MPSANASPGLRHRRRGEDLTDTGSGDVDEHRLDLVQPIDDRCLAAVEQRRQNPVGDHRRGGDSGITVEPIEQVQRLGHRHLLGRGDDHDAGPHGVLEDVSHPLRLLSHHAQLHQLADDTRGADLGDDVTTRLRVDDDEVVVLLSHLVCQLADGKDLFDAGRRVGDEVERARQRTDAPDQRQLHEEPQVLAQRVLGVHRHRGESGLERARCEIEHRRIERRGEITLGVHLAHQDIAS